MTWEWVLATWIYNGLSDKTGYLQFLKILVFMKGGDYYHFPTPHGSIQGKNEIYYGTNKLRGTMKYSASYKKFFFYHTMYMV